MSSFHRDKRKGVAVPVFASRFAAVLDNSRSRKDYFIFTSNVIDIRMETMQEHN